MSSARSFLFQSGKTITSNLPRKYALRAVPSSSWSCARSLSTSSSVHAADTTSSSPSPSATTPTGDFSLPHIELGQTHPSRYLSHYEQTLAEDLLYMTYDPRHSSESASSSSSSLPIDSRTPSPYEINRPAPSPRGNRPARPNTTPVSATTLPRLESIILHTMVKESIGNKPGLLSAIMAMRAISGETSHGGGRKGSKGVEIVQSRNGAAAFKLRAGMPVGVKVELKGQAMYDFVQSLVDFVLPRIRDYPGILLPPSGANKLSTSAVSGVVAFGLEPAAMALFPQISVNLDNYPRMHGFHIQVLTNCKGKDAQMRARTLLSGLGLPFARRGEVRSIEKETKEE